MEDGSGQHSIFAKAFIDILQENTSYLDGTELFSKIRRPVILGADQTPEYSDIRRAGHEGGDFIFLAQGSVIEEVIKRPEQRQQLKPQKSQNKIASVTGKLRVKTQPSRAKVYINDVYEGQSPLSLDLPVGVVSVRATKKGHQAAEERVRVQRDRGMTSTLLLKTTTNTSERENENAFHPVIDYLLGTWKSQIKNNHFEMTVTWNEKENRYEGVLTKQGELSQYAGFSFGELFWTATPTDNPDEIEQQVKYRTGNNGVPISYEWRKGLVDLSRSSDALLVLDFGHFTKRF